MSRPQPGLAEPPQLPPDLLAAVAACYGHYYRGVNTLDPRRVAEEALSRERIAEQWEHLGRSVGPLAGRNLLEIGSGFGLFVAEATRRGADAHGIEPDDPTVYAAYPISQRLLEVYGLARERIRAGTGEALPFADATFDVVFSTNVLEHTQDPVRVLAEAARVLRPGGAMQIVVPNYRSLYEGHYGIPWIPGMPKAMARLWVRLFGREASFVDTLAFVTPRTVREGIREAARRGHPLEDIDLGIDLFVERMTTRRFSDWADLAKVKAALRILDRLHLTALATRACVALGLYSPIVLTARRAPSR